MRIRLVWSLITAGIFFSSSAWAQGALRMTVTGDETVPGGRPTTLLATVQNAGTVTLQGVLIVSLTMSGVEFLSVTSSDPALTCGPTPGAPNSQRCIGMFVTMVPNGTITITAVVRALSPIANGVTLRMLGTAAGFGGQVASGSWSIQVVAGRGFDLQPRLTLTAGTLTIEIGPTGQVLSSTMKEGPPLGHGDLVVRSQALVARVEIVNVGDATNQSPFTVELIRPIVDPPGLAPPGPARWAAPGGSWPRCGDFPGFAIHTSTVTLAPGDKITLCQAIGPTAGLAFRLNAKTRSPEDFNLSNDETASEYFEVELRRAGDLARPGIIKKTGGR